MAKNYRTLKFTYNSTTLEIDILTSLENVSRNEIYITQEALDGTPYDSITGSNITLSYSYSFCDSDVFDFFDELYIQKLAGSTITLEREEDDGTFTEYTNVIVRKPQYQDFSLTDVTAQKVYQNLSVEIIVK